MRSKIAAEPGGRYVLYAIRSAAAAAFVCVATLAAAADDVVVSAVARDGAVAVSAQARLRTPLPVIWQTLTDYQHLPEFVPGMKKSRIVARDGAAAVVEQSGAADFVLFSYPVEVVVESVERPPFVVEIRVLQGNLKQLNGRYQIDRDPSDARGYILRWQGVIEPVLPLPALIALPLMRAAIESQFRGMVREIERRQASRIAG